MGHHPTLQNKLFTGILLAMGREKGQRTSLGFIIKHPSSNSLRCYRSSYPKDFHPAPQSTSLRWPERTGSSFLDHWRSHSTQYTFARQRNPLPLSAGAWLIQLVCTTVSSCLLYIFKNFSYCILKTVLWKYK